MITDRTMGRLARLGVIAAVLVSCLLASEQAVARDKVYEMAPSGNPLAQRPEAEIKALEARAAAGDGEAAFEVGDYYYRAFGVSELSKHRKWMEVSAEAGNVEAQYQLFFCYISTNCGFSFYKAVYWLGEAAEGGFPKQWHHTQQCIFGVNMVAVRIITLEFTG